MSFIIYRGVGEGPFIIALCSHVLSFRLCQHSDLAYIDIMCIYCRSYIYILHVVVWYGGWVLSKHS